jgi:hypothetical protein
MKSLSKGWKAFLLLSFIAGLLLRTLYVRDMEYKEDERYDFTQSQLIGNGALWPAYGIASGVYIVNPGMSVWVFAILAKVSNATTPTELARALQLFSWLGISLVLVFAFLFIEKPEDRIAWFWVFSLAMVNPMAILYQRKLWPEPFLPFFSMIFLMGWYRRERLIGAFGWGLVGAILGQIHMSGFFFAGALFLWTAVFGRTGNQRTHQRTQWKAWFIGSVIGSLPLIPWAIYVLQHPTPHAINSGWGEALQFKYWDFWIGDAFGLHLGNTLGIYIGDSQIEQLSDFARYPIIAGHATYVVALAHLAIIGCMIWTLIQFARWVSLEVRKSWGQLKRDIVGVEPETTFAKNSALLGSGILMTLTNVNIRRYYMMVTFPFEQFWISSFALKRHGGKVMLGVLWFAQLLISAHFVGYIHVNQGSPKGDYGDAYHVVMERQSGTEGLPSTKGLPANGPPDANGLPSKGLSDKDLSGKDLKE